jgi:hypothetical protein
MNAAVTLALVHPTRNRLQLAIYFCLHRGQCAGKHYKLASLVWIADVRRGNGQRCVVRVDEILTAFLELESAFALAMNYLD